MLRLATEIRDSLTMAEFRLQSVPLIEALCEFGFTFSATL